MQPHHYKLAFLLSNGPDETRIIRTIRQSLPTSSIWVTHRADCREQGAHAVITWQPDVVVTNKFGVRLLNDLGGVDVPLFLISSSHRAGSSVGIDERELAELAVAHFVERGYRHICYFGTMDFGQLRKRAIACQQAMERAKLQPQTFHPNWHGKNWRQIDSEMGRWLRQLPKPIGIICEHDGRARHVAEACLQFNINAPDDVAILGVGNDVDLCETVHPPLSSIELPLDAIGHALSGYIVQAVEQRQVQLPSVQLPPTRIVSRASTDSLAIDDPQVARAIQFIRHHFDDNIGVPDVVAQTTISRRTLEMRFQHIRHRTILEEVRSQRLKHARHLLRETDWSMEKIAKESGFASGASFGLVFKREIGNSPRAYRQSHT